MYYYALNGFYLVNQALRILKKKKGVPLGPAGLVCLFTCFVLQGRGIAITQKAVRNELQDHNRMIDSPQQLWAVLKKLVEAGLLARTQKTKGAAYIVTPSGLVLINDFELILRRCRMDR